MGKNVMLSEEAYAALSEHKRKDESFSDVIKRLAPPPLRTFGDLEKYLETLEGPLFSDMAALERVRARKKRANAH
jgi:predicted CopG family antitoxin